MAHHVAATPAIKKTTGELPEPPVGGRGSAVILYRLAGSVHPLPRNAGVRHGHRHPLLRRLHRVLAPSAVASPVLVHLGDLALLSVAPVEPPDAVQPASVQAGGDFRGYHRRDLLEGMRPIHVIADHPPQERLVPEPPTPGVGTPSLSESSKAATLRVLMAGRNEHC